MFLKWRGCFCLRHPLKMPFSNITIPSEPSLCKTSGTLHPLPSRRGVSESECLAGIWGELCEPQPTPTLAMLALSVSWMPTLYFSAFTEKTICPTTLNQYLTFSDHLDLELSQPWPPPHDVKVNHSECAHLQMVQREGIFWVPALSRLISLLQALLSPQLIIWSVFSPTLQPFPSCCWTIYWVTPVSWLLVPLKNEVLVNKQQL